VVAPVATPVVAAVPVPAPAPSPAVPAVSAAPAAAPTARHSRVPGCLIGCLIVGLVLVGILAGLGFWLWKATAGQVKQTLTEAVACAGGQGELPAVPVGVTFTPYVNKTFGFTSELPASWRAEVKDNAIVFSGAEGTEEYHTTINFQIVRKEAGSSLQG